MAVERAARLARIVDHGFDTRSLFLDLPEPLRFAPGQFVSCLLPGPSGVLTKPYSIASDPEAPAAIELLLNLVPGGGASAYLFSLRPGATVRYTGPWGTFTLERAPDAEVVFVADGTAVAPIRPMLRRALATATRPVTLLYGLPAPGAMLYADELRAPAAPHGYALVAIPSADLEAEVRRRFVDADDDRRRHFFVCGVGDRVHRLRDLLRAAGYERRAVRYERW